MAIKGIKSKGKNVLRKRKGSWKLDGPGAKWLDASMLKVIYVGSGKNREKIAIFRVR